MVATPAGSVIDRLHGGLVHSRRVRVLCEKLAALIPPNARVLDIGCGDGLLASLIQARRPDISIEGIDVLVRPGTHIPVRAFDGERIESASGSYDVAMLVDVLHHTLAPQGLLAEAVRVSRGTVLIKDHTRNGFLAKQTLAFMDWVGNARYGVSLPYNYLSLKEWEALFSRVGLTVRSWNARLGLYPWWGRMVFERRLHFVASLAVGAQDRVS